MTDKYKKYSEAEYKKIFDNIFLFKIINRISLRSLFASILMILIIYFIVYLLILFKSLTLQIKFITDFIILYFNFWLLFFFASFFVYIISLAFEIFYEDRKKYNLDHALNLYFRLLIKKKSFNEIKKISAILIYLLNKKRINNLFSYIRNFFKEYRYNVKDSDYFFVRRFEFKTKVIDKTITFIKDSLVYIGLKKELSKIFANIGNSLKNENYYEIEKILRDNEISKEISKIKINLNIKTYVVFSLSCISDWINKHYKTIILIIFFILLLLNQLGFIKIIPFMPT